MVITEANWNLQQKARKCTCPQEAIFPRGSEASASQNARLHSGPSSSRYPVVPIPGTSWPADLTAAPPAMKRRRKLGLPCWRKHKRGVGYWANGKRSETEAKSCKCFLRSTRSPIHLLPISQCLPPKWRRFLEF